VNGGCSTSKKQKRATWAFFVVRTPADKQQQQRTSEQQEAPAATADVPTPVGAAVDSSTSAAAAAAAAAGAGVAAQPELLPAWLLQLPSLPGPACHALLTVAYRLLTTALASQQQQQQKPTAHLTPGD
jgi:hypothetical protein